MSRPDDELEPENVPSPIAPLQPQHPNDRRFVELQRAYDVDVRLQETLVERYKNAAPDEPRRERHVSLSAEQEEQILNPDQAAYAKIERDAAETQHHDRARLLAENAQLRETIDAEWKVFTAQNNEFSRREEAAVETRPTDQDATQSDKQHHPNRYAPLLEAQIESDADAARNELLVELKDIRKSADYEAMINDPEWPAIENNGLKSELAQLRQGIAQQQLALDQTRDLNAIDVGTVEFGTAAAEQPIKQQSITEPEGAELSESDRTERGAQRQEAYSDHGIPASDETSRPTAAQLDCEHADPQSHHNPYMIYGHVSDHDAREQQQQELGTQLADAEAAIEFYRNRSDQLAYDALQEYTDVRQQQSSRQSEGELGREETEARAQRRSNSPEQHLDVGDDDDGGRSR